MLGPSGSASNVGLSIGFLSVDRRLATESAFVLDFDLTVPPGVEHRAAAIGALAVDLVWCQAKGCGQGPGATLYLGVLWTVSSAPPSCGQKSGPLLNWPNSVAIGQTDQIRSDSIKIGQN